MRFVAIYPVVLAGLVAGGATSALAATSLQPVHQGNVTYVSGGIGLNEERALDAEAKNYNLEITNAVKGGAFTAGTTVVIDGSNGRSVLRATDTGPMLLAKLPPGQYTIHAVNGAQRRTNEVRIANGKSADLHLIWHRTG